MANPICMSLACMLMLRCGFTTASTFRTGKENPRSSLCRAVARYHGGCPATSRTYSVDDRGGEKGQPRPMPDPHSSNPELRRAIVSVSETSVAVMVVHSFQARI